MRKKSQIELEIEEEIKDEKSTAGRLSRWSGSRIVEVLLVVAILGLLLFQVIVNY